MSFKPRVQRPKFASDLTTVNQIQGRPNTVAPPMPIYAKSAPINIPQQESESDEDDEWTISRIMYEKPSKKIVRQFFRDRVEKLEEEAEEF